MARPRSEIGFGFFLDPPNNRMGRYRFICYKVGKYYRCRMVFYSDKIHAGAVAEAMFNNLMAGNQESCHVEKPHKVQSSDGNPVFVVQGANIYMNRWAEGRSGRIEEHSITQTIARFNNHFIPHFRGLKLGDVTVDDIRRYEAALSAKGLTPKTVSMCMGEGRKFFEYAAKQGWIPSTPFDDTYVAPDAKPAKHRIPYEMDTLRMACLSHWNNPVFRAMVWLIRFTGARASEIRAIKKSSFEPYYGHDGCEDCVIVHIVESLTTKNKSKAPKNKRSRDTVIPRWLYEFIRPVFDLSESDLAFSCTHGEKPTSLDKLLENFRKSLAEVTGWSMDYMSSTMRDIHAIRTTLNSYLTGNLNDNLRQSILGWASEDVGLDHYFQLLPIHYQQVLDALKTITTAEEVEWCGSHNIFE